MLTSSAMKVGFSGGLVVDFPHSTRAKKFFLVLMVGGGGMLPQARGMDGGEPSDDEDGSDAEQHVRVAGRKTHKRRKTGSGKEVRRGRTHKGVQAGGWG